MGVTAGALRKPACPWKAQRQPGQAARVAGPHRSTKASAAGTPSPQTRATRAQSAAEDTRRAAEGGGGTKEAPRTAPSPAPDVREPRNASCDAEIQGPGGQGGRARCGAARPLPERGRPRSVRGRGEIAGGRSDEITRTAQIQKRGSGMRGGGRGGPERETKAWARAWEPRPRPRARQAR